MLDPNWVTGFTDGEGCFGIYIYRKGFSIKLRKDRLPMISVEYSIQLREDDYAVLQQIQVFFGCGTLAKNSRAKARKDGAENARDQVSFKVRSMQDLLTKVVPHFERYPLRSKKATDFEHWKKALALIDERAKIPVGKLFRAERAVLLERVLDLTAELRKDRNKGLRLSPVDMTFSRS